MTPASRLALLVAIALGCSAPAPPPASPSPPAAPVSAAPPTAPVGAAPPAASAPAPASVQPTVVYCGSGKRAAQARELLLAAGFGRVVSAGGIDEWPQD
ncbi:MAG: rhodanese-like domain-containing protein [Deltaproteobacteria bacterium]|nr:rhodanese-like domain-containing protein [Deltaproteobacteria bacterium]